MPAWRLASQRDAHLKGGRLRRGRRQRHCWRQVVFAGIAAADLGLLNASEAHSRIGPVHARLTRMDRFLATLNGEVGHAINNELPLRGWSVADLDTLIAVG